MSGSQSPLLNLRFHFAGIAVSQGQLGAIDTGGHLRCVRLLRLCTPPNLQALQPFARRDL